MDILDKLLEIRGVCRAGIAIASPVDDIAFRRYLEWLKRGKHAGMDYLTRYEEIRRDPRLLLPGAKSIVSLAFSYHLPEEVRKENSGISEYALFEDYHDSIRKILREADIRDIVGEKEGEDFRICVDSAPIMERYWAARSGVGFIGDNGALIVPGVGCEVFLAEIITTLELKPTQSLTRECSHCGRCRDACPYGALGENGEIDCNRCLSYLTIEHKGAWNPGVQLEAMNTAAGRETIFGCDRCMSVCSHNNCSIISQLPRHEGVNQLTRQWLKEATTEDFSRLMRKSPIKRARLEGLRRNIQSDKSAM